MFMNTKIFRNISFLSLAAYSIIAASCSDKLDSKTNVTRDYTTLLAASDDSREKIRSVIFDQYLRGQKIQSAETIRQAFSPESVMLYSYQNGAKEYQLDRWLDMHDLVGEWAEQSSPDMDLSKFNILSLDIVDERIAVVTLKVEDRVFDALTLVKEGDDWKIASKVYVSQKN